MTAIEIRSEHHCFSGTQGFYSHVSQQTGCKMNFAVFVPEQAKHAPVPALYCLAGLTCNEETFAIKAGAQRFAAEVGLMLVACDTSPRGLNLPSETESWDFGVGAGFYIDATQAPWSKHYRMGSYINRELPELIEANFPANSVRGIMGHSMGGHGALVTALRNPERWSSISAYAPISHPVEVPWGQKAFSRYLGDERSAWQAWDASVLMSNKAHPSPILVDQGMNDQFLSAQLMPAALEVAAAHSGQQLIMRKHEHYDHSYWFIQSFIADHVRHHARLLKAAN